MCEKKNGRGREDGKWTSPLCVTESVKYVGQQNELIIPSEEHVQSIYYIDLYIWHIIQFSK